MCPRKKIEYNTFGKKSKWESRCELKSMVKILSRLYVEKLNLAFNMCFQ
jgi:hypothetical protein